MGLDQIKWNLRDYLASKGIDHSGYFHCFNPEHSGGDTHPSMKIDDDHGHKTPYAHCFGCGVNFSIVEAIRYLDEEGKILDEKEAIRRAFQMYGDAPVVSPKMPAAPKKKSTSSKKEKHSETVTFSVADYPDFSEQVEAAHQRFMAAKPDLTEYSYQSSRVVNDPKSMWMYFMDRGIPQELIEAYKIGYTDRYNTLVAPHATHRLFKENNKTPVTGKTIDARYPIILPYLDQYGKASFFAAEVGDRSLLGERYMSGKYHKVKGLKAPIFNERYITSAENNPEGVPPVVVLCEGYYDALSYEAVGLPAIGLIGVGARRFIALVEKYKPDTKFIIALDADSTGKGAGEIIKKSLFELSVPYASYSTEALGKDANEALTTRFDDFSREVKQMKKELESISKKELLEKNNRDQHLKDWESYKKEKSSKARLSGLLTRLKANFTPTPSGFANLDELLDGGFRSGIWALGGMPGTGKSDWCVNLACQLAQMGKKVVYVTIEMDADELMARAIARETALISLEAGKGTSLAVPAAILDRDLGELQIVVDSAIERYEKYAGNLFILDDLEDKSAQGIYDEIERIIKMINIPKIEKTPEGELVKVYDRIEDRPFLIVDYAQILDPMEGFERATDKQQVDQTMKALSKLYLDYKLEILPVSSFNRASYNTEASLNSFKESGGIDAFVHGAMGLQTKRVGSDKADDLAEMNNKLAQSGQAIEIELSIMKNRRGSKGKVHFKYFPKFSLFVPTEPPAKKIQRGRKLA